jgi:hypothetical protein
MSRRNFKQEQLKSKIEQYNVMIQSCMLSGEWTIAQKDETLSRLFEEKCELEKRLRTLQMNQERQKRFRAKKIQEEQKMEIGLCTSSQDEADCQSLPTSESPSSPECSLPTFELPNVKSEFNLQSFAMECDNQPLPQPQAEACFDLNFAPLSNGSFLTVSNTVCADEVTFLNDLVSNLSCRTEAQTMELLDMRRVFLAESNSIGAETAKAALNLRLQIHDIDNINFSQWF